MPSARATCEPCRLRRIKCDFRERGDACSSCIKRGWQCPGVAVPQSRKPRRGAVVDQVELLQSPAESQSSSPAPVDLSLVALSLGSPAEMSMVKLELQSELSLSMISAFDITHGRLWRGMDLGLYQRSLQAVNGRFDELDPNLEIMIRVMLSLGARTTMHPVILNGGDTKYPLTLGLTREAPCRALVGIALSRYEQLGIWRKPTLEAVQIAFMMHLLSRTMYDDVEVARPYADTAVSLYKQCVRSATDAGQPLSPYALQLGPMVLYVDVRSSLETMSRPAFTEDDLDDIPALKQWLYQDLRDDWESESEMMQMFQSQMVQICRRAIGVLHKAIRQNQPSSLDDLPKVWNDAAVLGDRVLAQLAVTFQDPRISSPDVNVQAEAHMPVAMLGMICGTLTFLNLTIHNQLRKALGRSGQIEILLPFVESYSRCQEAIKRIGKYSKIISTGPPGPPTWIQMTRMFVTLDVYPDWIEFISGESNTGIITDEDYQNVLNGLQQAGFGAGFASMRWLEAVQARGGASISELTPGTTPFAPPADP